MFYEDWIDSRFILLHKGILIIMQGFTRDNEQGLWIELIDYLDDSMWTINQLWPILS